MHGTFIVPAAAAYRAATVRERMGCNLTRSLRRCEKIKNWPRRGLERVARGKRSAAPGQSRRKEFEPRQGRQKRIHLKIFCRPCRGLIPWTLTTPGCASLARGYFLSAAPRRGLDLFTPSHGRGSVHLDNRHGILVRNPSGFITSCSFATRPAISPKTNGRPALDGRPRKPIILRPRSRNSCRSPAISLKANGQPPPDRRKRKPIILRSFAGICALIPPAQG